MAPAEVLPIARYYEDHAEDYTLLADDRDFRAQVAALSRAFGGVKGPWLELFAGPARHSVELAALCGVDTWAIDVSPAMRALALKLGFGDPARYLLRSLPELDLPPSLDAALAGALLLRYSSGYLDPLEMERLLAGLRPSMRRGAAVVFELHDLDLLRASLEDLDIRSRHKVRPDGTEIVCVWPAGALRWHRTDWRVDMDVLIEVFAADGRLLERRRYVSQEHIHTSHDIARAALRVGGFRVVNPPDVARTAFPQSVLVGMECV